MVDFSNLASLQDYLKPDPNAGNTSGNLFVSALKSGGLGAAGGIAGAAAAGAGALGASDTAKTLEGYASSLNQQAEQAGRADIERQGFFDHGITGFARKGAYEFTKMLPTLAGVVGAGAVAGAVLPEATVAGAGSLIPAVLRGSGANLARAGAGLIGGTGVLGAESTGQLYNEASKQPGGGGQGDALKAIAMGLPLGAIQSLIPATGAGSIFGAREAAGLAGRVAREGLSNAAAGAVGSGLQTAAAQSFDPNMSAFDRAKNIVTSAVSGGAFGGLLGGVFGLAHGVAEGNPSTDALKAASDTLVSPQQSTAPIEPQAYPGPAPAPVSPAEAGNRAPAPTVGEDAAQSAAAPYAIRRGLGENYQPQAPTAEGLVDQFMAAYPNRAAPIRVRYEGDPGTMLPGPSPTALRLTDQRAPEAREDYVPTQPSGEPIEARDLSDRPWWEEGAINLPDQSTMEPGRNYLPVPVEPIRDPRSGFRDETAANVNAFARMRQEAVERAVGGDVADPVHPEEPPVAPIRLDAAQTLGPDTTAAALPRPEDYASRQDYANALAESLRTAPREELYGDLAGPAVGDDAPFGQRREAERDEADRQDALARLYRQFGITPEERAARVAARTPAADGTPRSIAQRVVETAQEMTGGTGGEVKIADIRKALPDVASSDIENALREIHGDDSDHTLTQAPRGQRAGVDGVTVPGQGRFHNLSVEARDGGVQERGAEAPAATDEPRSVSEARSGDAAGEGATGTGEEGEAVRQQGETPEPATGEEGAAPVDGDTPRAAALRAAMQPNEVTRPMAAEGLTSYRYRGLRGDIAIGANSHADALGQAQRSLSVGKAVDRNLEVWNGEKYVPATNENEPAPPTVTRANKTGPALRSRAMSTSARMRAEELARRDAAEPETSPARAARVSDQTPEGRRANQAAAIVRMREAMRAKAGPSTDPVRPLPARRNVTEAQAQRQATQVAAENLGSPGAPQGPVAVPAPALPEAIKPKLAYDPATRAPTYSDDAARSDFRDLTKSLKSDVSSRVHLVDGIDALPDSFREQAERQGLDLAKVPAAYHGGEVYLRTDLMSSRADMEDAIAHEVFGHMATAQRVDGRFGAGQQTAANFEASMSSAFDRAGGLSGLEKIARKFGVWDGTPSGGEGLRGYLPDDTSSLTPHQKANLLDELIAHAAAGTEVGRKQRALMEFVGGVKQVVADFLRKQGLDSFADRMSRFTANDVAKWVADSRTAMTETPPKNAIDLASLGDSRLRFIGGPAAHEPIMAKMIRSQNEETGGVNRLAGSLQALVDRMPDTSNLTRAAGKAYAKIESGYGMVRRYGANIPAMRDHYQLAQQRSVIEARVNEAHAVGAKATADLYRKDRGAAAEVQELMQRATSANIDPTRPWSEHTWLTEGVDMTNPDEVRRLTQLRAEHAELSKIWNALGQKADGAGQRAYRLSETVQRGDNYARMVVEAQTLHDLLFAPGEGIAGFERNAGLDYLEARDAHTDPDAYEAYWKGQFESRNAAMTDYAQENRVAGGDGSSPEMLDPENKPLPRNASQGSVAIEQMASMLAKHKDEVSTMGQGPYFHLGRQGDFFVSAHLATDPDGNVAPETYKALQDALTASKFGDVGVNTLTNNAHIFMRVKSPAEYKSLLGVIKGLDDHLDPSKEPSGGSLTNGADFKTGDAPLLDRAMARVNARLKDVSPELREHIGNEYRAALIDILPEKSIRKVYEQREGKQGYSKNQLANNVYRGQVTARAIATAATRPGSLDAVAAMHRQAREVKYADPDNSVKVGDAIDNYLSRTAAASVRVPQNMVDAARGMVHKYYLAGSPAYVVMQLSQLGTLTLPELGRKYGYAKSMAALTQAAPEAMRVLSAITKAGHFDTGAITEDVIQKAGVSRSTQSLLRELTNGGHLELGSYARSMGEQAAKVSQTRTSKFLAYANGTATMSEVAGRLVAAIAADRLHASDPKRSGFADPHDYAGHVLSESMFNWGSYDTPQLFTAGGPLGQAGPLVFQFHQFATKLFEKVTHEAYNGFVARGEDAAEARQFMYGHLAAVTFLAGSLGLPAAGWSAAAATRLTGLFNDGEGYDVQAHYRNFLAGMFGKDVGEILARGVPRYLGVDTSDLGDRDFLPMQSLLEDHRSLKDAMGSYLAQAWGSTPSLVINAANSMQLVAQGRVGEALAHTLPTAVRNGVKAYRLSEYGYLNAKGEKMPLDPSSMDVLKTALGFKPGEEAEEEERTRVVQNANEDKKAHAGVLKQKFAIANERGDTSGMASAMDAIRAYDLDPAHRGQPIGPSLPAYLASRRQAVAYSKATNMPIGTSPKDLAARGLLGF